MGALDPRVSRVLDELVPPRPGPEGWDAIVGAAGQASPGRRRWLAAALPAACAVVVAAFLALAWPFGGGPQGTILERAAAAIGDGPVLHVVIRSGWSHTLVDVETGERRVIHGESEFWYDPARGVHRISRFDGIVQDDAILPPGQVAQLEKGLNRLVTGYRGALRDGSARVLESDVVEGKPVSWIRVWSRMLHAGADAELNELAHDVAVSTETFKVVATRETLDGRLTPSGISIVLEAESLPAGEGDFRRLTPDLSGSVFEVGWVAGGSAGTGSFTTSEASGVLGRRALWAGERVNGLELARVWEDERKGQYVEDEHWRTYGGVTFFYGALDDDGNPRWSEPHVRISQSLTRDRGFHGGPAEYTPPEGSALLTGGPNALMHEEGVYLNIGGSSQELVLEAARALEPVPAG